MAVTGSTDVMLLATIVEAGGLSAAARRLDLSPASISGRLADLERRLGVILLHRTSRTLRLTTVGLAYLEATRPVLALLDTAEAAVRSALDPTGAAIGTTRLAAPVDIGRQYVTGMVDEFLTRHPKAHVELFLSDDVTDITRQGMDLAVRYGEMANSNNTTASMLVRNHRVICGSPDYLDRRGRPQGVEELALHNCLCLRTARNVISRWPVGRALVPVRGDRSSNDGAVLRDWALRGFGLILKSWWDVRRDIDRGRLETVLVGQPPVAHPLRLVRPSGQDVPIRVRLLADHLRTEFRRLPSRPPG